MATDRYPGPMTGPSTVSLRPLCPEDLSQVLVIEQLCYASPGYTPWTKSHFEAELNKAYARLLVLTDDETDTLVLGYVVYWIQAEGASLLNLCVHPDWRGLGFGSKLLQGMIREIVRDEIPKISLEVRESNASARTLYARAGFKVTGTRKNFYSNGESAITMEVQTSDLSPKVH